MERKSFKNFLTRYYMLTNLRALNIVTVMVKIKSFDLGNVNDLSPFADRLFFFSEIH